MNEADVNWKTVGVSLVTALVPTVAALLGAAKWQGSTDAMLKSIDQRMSKIESLSSLPIVTRYEFESSQRTIDDSRSRLDSMAERVYRLEQRLK